MKTVDPSENEPKGKNLLPLEANSKCKTIALYECAFFPYIVDTFQKRIECMKAS